ncbi:hypothetical protein [Akkermansia sp. BCRC 18949]|uniref:hypothetical protein n=1 Tax=Akkermansia sp. BCRC 18949 TaxID=3037987 RepID=UPI00384F9DF1
MQAGEDDTAYDNERHNHGLPAICLGSNIEQGPPVIVFDGWLFFHQGAFLKLSHALPAASRAIPGCRWEYVSCRLKESGTFTANTLYGRTFFPEYPFMTFKPAEGKENQAPNRCRKEETVWRADKRTRQGKERAPWGIASVSPNLVALPFAMCWNRLMNKWFLFSLCMLFGAVLSPLLAGEAESSPPDSGREQVDSSVWINDESPHLAPVYFTGVMHKRSRWEIDIISLNSHELPEPMTVALEKKPAGFTSSAGGTPCCGIIPLLIASGAEEEPRRWRDAGASPSLVKENTPQALSLLQESVLQSYQHQIIKSIKMTIGILERMTDEKQALALEKSWAYEIIDYTFWILLEGSVPFDARMAYVQRNPDVLKQSQKESDAYCERVRILRSKPWSGKLRLLQDKNENLPAGVPSCLNP